MLLVTLDTTRADHVGVYGRGGAHTPRLDAIARDGVLVRNAIAAAPITAPAHSTILTGLLPPAHGVRDNGTFRLPDAVQTLPELLKQRGYATAAFVSAAVLDSRYNLSQGFDTYEDNLWTENAPPMFMIRERSGARTAQLATEWLKKHRAQHPTQPFFVWVHLFDVHEPHHPSPLDAMVTPSRYDAEITGVDRQVGKLVDVVAPETLIAVTADHGESLGEHGESTHGIFVYQSTLHIPLLLRWTGHIPAGSVYKGPAHQVDLFPTLLAATATKVPSNQGANLLDALAGRAQASERPLYSESKLSELGFGMAPLHSVRRGKYTYIRAPRPELYDRDRDPSELHNLIGEKPEVAAKLSADLDSILKDSQARGFEAPANPIDRETEESLRALGYVGDSQTRKEVASMDPKDGIRVYEQLQQARQLVRNSRYDEAKAILKQLLESTPRNISAINVLALSEVRGGQLEKAEKLYLDSLNIEPNQPRVHLMLANMLSDLRRLDDAVAHAKAAMDLSPGYVEALVVLGFLELGRGNKAQADAYYDRALEVDAKYPRAQRVYADMFFRQAQYAKALEYYRRALEVTPRNFDALIQTGLSAHRIGDYQAALEFYQRAAELRPDSWLPPYNAACVHALAGDKPAAFEQLKLAVSNDFANVDLLRRDPDFVSVRREPEFVAMVKKLRPNARAESVKR